MQIYQDTKNTRPPKQYSSFFHKNTCLYLLFLGNSLHHRSFESAECQKSKEEMAMGDFRSDLVQKCFQFLGEKNTQACSIVYAQNYKEKKQNRKIIIFSSIFKTKCFDFIWNNLT